MRVRRALPGLPVLPALLFAGAAAAAPQTFNTALPVAAGQWLLRGQFVYRHGDAPDGETQAIGAAAVAGYGIMPDLALFAAVPWLDKRLERDGLERSEAGIGDLRLFARYTAFQRNWTGRTLRIAPFAGLELPTGEDEARDRLGRLPPSLQPGSGGLDAFFGTVATYQTLEYQLDAQLAYQANGEGDFFEPGDVFRADASLQYRLWPRTLGPGVPGFLYGTLEANLAHSGDLKVEGLVRDSGGTEVFISPGLQYVTRRWVVEAAVQLPVVRDFGPAGVESDLRVLAGFRVNF